MILNFFLEFEKNYDFSKSHGHSSLVIRYDSKKVFLFHQLKNTYVSDHYQNLMTYVTLCLLYHVQI